MPSLSHKIIAALFLVLGLVFIVIGGMAVRSEEKMLYRIQARYGKNMAETIATFCIESLLSEDYPVLNSFLSITGKKEKEIVSIQILQDDVVVSEYSNAETPSEEYRIYQADVVFESGRTVHRLGEVRLGLSTAENKEIVMSRVLQILVFTMLIFCLIFLTLTLILKQLVITPVNLLARGAADISEGNTSLRLPDTLGYEFAVLARTFNGMLDAIAESRNTLEQSVKELRLEAEHRLVAEDQAAKEKERLELVVYATNIGTWEWEVQSGKTVFNERWAEIVGYSLAELEPISIQTWVDLCHPEDFKHSEELLEKHFNGGIDLYDFECRMRHKDGRWVWVHDRGSVVEWGADGRPLRMAGTHADISERKQAEYELRKAKDTLEERVEERTKALAHAHSQLAMQDKMASVGQLAAGLAHEINNPINFVRTNFAALMENISDLLEMMDGYRRTVKAAEDAALLSDQVAEMRQLEQTLNIEYLLADIPVLFEESEHGFVRVAKIIQSMRDFSRVDSGNDRSRFDINKGIEDTLTIAQNEYKYYAEIEKNLGHLPEIYCNPEQLNQVFLNLIINSTHAVASMGEGSEGIIGISTSHDQDYIYCEIRDNGPGIPVEQRKQIFDPFFTTKDPGKGTGLGLSISYDIVVNKHCGTIAVDCPETGGTVFSIRLPLNSNEAREQS